MAVESTVEEILDEIVKAVAEILDSEEVKEKVPAKYLAIAKAGLKIIEVVLAGRDEKASELVKDLLAAVEQLLSDPEVQQALPKKYMFVVKLALKLLKLLI